MQLPDQRRADGGPRARSRATGALLAGSTSTTVFFVNSGAEANENALKLAFRMTGRPHVAAIEGGFHGRTAGAGAVTWGAAQKWYSFPRAPFDVSFHPARRSRTPSPRT